MSRLKRLPKRALIALLALAVFVPVYFLSLMRDQDDPAQHQPVPRRRFRPSLMFLVLPALGLFLAVYLFTQCIQDGVAPVERIWPQAAHTPFYRLLNDPCGIRTHLKDVKKIPLMAIQPVADLLAA